MTSVASTAAVVGGALWGLQWVVGPGDDPLGLTLLWGGLACLLVAAAATAVGLVTGDVVALRLLVMVAAPLLLWSVIDFFRPDDAGGWYHGCWGVAAVVVGGSGLWRSWKR